MKKITLILSLLLALALFCLPAFAEEAAEAGTEAVEAAAESAEGWTWSWANVSAAVTNWCVNTGIKILIALVVLCISFLLINFFTKRLGKHMEKSKRVDKTLARTFVYIIRIVLKILVVIALIGYLGIDTSAFAALVGMVLVSGLPEQERI